MSEQAGISILCNPEEIVYRTVFENTTACIFVTGSDGYFIEATQPFCKLVGYSISELRAMTRDKIIGQNLETPREYAENENGTAIPVRRTFYVHKDGGKRLLYERAHSIRDKRGELRYRVVTVDTRSPGGDGLLREHRRLEAVLQHSSDALSVIDERGLLIFSSPAAQRIHGFSAEDLRGINTFDLIHPDDRAQVQKALAHLLEDPDKPVRVEYRYATKNGDYIQMEAVASNQLDNPYIRGLVTNSRDISERLSAEIALRQSEENYRVLVENQTDMVVKIDTEGRFLFVSPSYCDVFGLSQHELLGSTFMPLVHEDDRAATAHAMEALYRPPHACYLEQRAMTTNGWRWIGWSDTAILDERGKVREIIGVGRDVTDRREVEDAERRSRRMLAAIWSTQSAFIAGGKALELFQTLLSALLEVTDSEYGFIGKVLYGDHGEPYLKTQAITDIAWNEETRRIFREQAPAGMEFRNLNTLFGAVMSTGEPVIANRPAEDPRRGGLPPGHPPLNAFLGLPFFHAGKMVGMAGIANRPSGYDSETIEFLQPIVMTCATIIEAEESLTAQELAQTELEKLNRELERRVQERTSQLHAANKELEAFSYSVSHDLRAPLRAIDGFSRALEEDCAESFNDEGREHLARVRNAAQRMDNLIDDLIKLSQVTRAELRVEYVDLTAVAREILEDFRDTHRGRAVDVSFYSTPRVKGDARLLRVLLENLLGNAWKFTSLTTEARIEFGFDAQQEGGAFFLRDNGAGFDMKYAGKLFRAFQRLHSPEEFEGTGIGLATVHRVLLRHGGHVWAQAERDGGATFYFTLPGCASNGAHAV